MIFRPYRALSPRVASTAQSYLPALLSTPAVWDEVSEGLFLGVECAGAGRSRRKVAGRAGYSLATVLTVERVAAELPPYSTMRTGPFRVSSCGAVH